MVNYTYREKGTAMRNYSFEDVWGNVVEVSVFGENRDGTKDICVSSDRDSIDFEEIDGGSADEVIAWMIETDIEFKDARHQWIVEHIIASCVLDGDDTPASVIGRGEELTDDQLKAYAPEYYRGE